MFTISTAVNSAFSEAKAQSLVAKIDHWLRLELPDWSAFPQDRRYSALKGLYECAVRSGMEVETDFGLFAWVMLLNGPEWQRFEELPDVRSVLKDPERDAVCKLYCLHDIAEPDGAAE